MLTVHIIFDCNISYIIANHLVNIKNYYEITLSHVFFSGSIEIRVAGSVILSSVPEDAEWNTENLPSCASTNLRAKEISGLSFSIFLVTVPSSEPRLDLVEAKCAVGAYTTRR